MRRRRWGVGVEGVVRLAEVPLQREVREGGQHRQRPLTSTSKFKASRSSCAAGGGLAPVAVPAMPTVLAARLRGASGSHVRGRHAAGGEQLLCTGFPLSDERPAVPGAARRVDGHLRRRGGGVGEAAAGAAGVQRGEGGGRGQEAGAAREGRSRAVGADLAGHSRQRLRPAVRGRAHRRESGVGGVSVPVDFAAWWDGAARRRPVSWLAGGGEGGGGGGGGGRGVPGDDGNVSDG